MILLLLLFGELVLLYLLAQGLTQSVYDLVYLVTRARSVAVTVVMLLNFPGTVIHELSHLFTAEILGVHTGKLTLVPESIQSDEIKAGSVMIAHSDPFRRYAIGLAPVFWGMTAIAALSYVLFNPNVLPFDPNYIQIFDVIIVYFLLAVSNSMFSSPEDVRGFIPFAIALGAIFGAAYLAGVRIGLIGAISSFATTIVDGLTKSLGLVLIINIVGLLVNYFLIFILGRLLKRKIFRK